MTKGEFTQGFSILKKALPSLKVDDEAGYFILEPLEYKDFMGAIKDILRDKDFKLYDNILGQIWDRAVRKNPLSPEEAWEQILIAMKRPSNQRYKDPKFEDPNIMRAVNVNTDWLSLCMSKDIKWDKKHFIGTYSEFQKRDIINARSSFEHKSIENDVPELQERN